MAGGPQLRRSTVGKQAVDLVEQLGGGRGLLHVHVGARRDRSRTHLGAVVRGVHGDLHLGRVRPDRRRGLQAVHDRHRDVQQDQIGMLLTDQLDGLPPVRRGAHHLHAVDGVEHRPQQRA